MDKVIKNKRILELMNSSLFMLWNKFTNASSLVIYYLTKFDSVINIKWFLSYFKKLHLQIYASQFMPLIIPLSFVLLSLESVERKRKKYKNLSFLDEIKNILHSLWGAIIWWKNKNLIKNSGHKL